MDRFTGKAAKTVLAGLIGLSVTLTPQAAFADWGEKGVDKRVEHMTEGLNLAPDQTTQVKAILEEEKAAIQKIREESQQKISAVLNAEQQEKYNQMKEKREEKMQKKHEGVSQ